jgi:hypothetical protein
VKTQRDRVAGYKAIEEVQRVRIENIRFCMEQAGSWHELARWTGMQATFLCQVAGPNPKRSVGEQLARSLEFSLGLPALWMDAKH